ncbi:MAG: hypothetical protein ACPGZR_14365, partial [Paracoccaceae bacterium]
PKICPARAIGQSGADRFQYLLGTVCAAQKIHYAFQHKGCALERAGPRFGFKPQVEGFVRQYIL